MAVAISRRYKCIFIHIPKVAGSSIQWSEIFQDQRERTRQIVSGHTSCVEIRDMYPDEFRAYYKFAFVRNPWDRLVSAYVYMSQGAGSLEESVAIDKYLKHCANFREFCRSLVEDNLGEKIIHLRPQYLWICDEKCDILLDYVGKFETLNTDFGVICSKIGFTGQLRHRRKGFHKHYSSYYDSESRRIVEEYYRKDIALFGYEFGSSAFEMIKYYSGFYNTRIQNIAKRVARKMKCSFA